MAVKIAGVAAVALLVALLVASAIGTVQLTVQRGIAALVSLMMLRVAQAARRAADIALETAAAGGSVISAILAFVV